MRPADATRGSGLRVGPRHCAARLRACLRRADRRHGARGSRRPSRGRADDRAPARRRRSRRERAYRRRDCDRAGACPQRDPRPHGRRRRRARWRPGHAVRDRPRAAQPAADNRHQDLALRPSGSHRAGAAGRRERHRGAGLALRPDGPPVMSAPHQLDERARAGFRQAFGYLPGAVAVAPGRINIIGEHTDYNEGFVLPAAIDRHIGVALRLRRDGRVVLHSDRYSMPVEVADLPSRRQGNWADYVFGVADVLRLHTNAWPGFEAAIVSDVPVGAGLSSSGALEVAVAVSLLAARGEAMPPLQIAKLCQAAENVFVGARTGIMDPFIALRARGGNAILLDCRSLEDQYVPLPDGRFVWLLADTRIRHELASS